MIQRQRVRIGFPLSVIIIALNGLISACSVQPEQSTVKMDLPSGTAKIHAVSHDRLRSYMHRLDTIVFEPHYSELERDQYRFQYTAKIVEVVTDLTEELERKPRLNLGLSSEQHVDFLNLALELKNQAQQLNTLLTGHKSHDLKKRMQQMMGTCNKCHVKYRSR